MHHLHSSPKFSRTCLVSLETLGPVGLSKSWLHPCNDGTSRNTLPMFNSFQKKREIHGLKWQLAVCVGSLFCHILLSQVVTVQFYLQIRRIFFNDSSSCIFLSPNHKCFLFLNNVFNLSCVYGYICTLPH